MQILNNFFKEDTEQENAALLTLDQTEFLIHVSLLYPAGASKDI